MDLINKVGTIAPGQPPRADPVLGALRGSKEYLTPAIALCLEMEQTQIQQPADILRFKGRIEAAIKQTEQEVREVDRVVRCLRQSAPVPAAFVPEGF